MFQPLSDVPGQILETYTSRVGNEPGFRVFWVDRPQKTLVAVQTYQSANEIFHG